jgi:glyoxylase-like metal-dependent hydrolase (beta-lactamase superfamily II)
MTPAPDARTTDWFTTRRLGGETWAIDDRGQDIIYLVSGDERALLIDTGWGVGDLPGLVASLTSRPLLVVNTHGHPDHTFGNGQFERVYIHPADARMMGKEPPLSNHAAGSHTMSCTRSCPRTSTWRAGQRPVPNRSPWRMGRPLASAVGHWK